MIKFKSSYLALAVAAFMGFTACQDDVDAPEMQIPQATWEPNTSILELKTRYWNDATNYIDTVALTDAGEHVIISGRVISSDASGNIYKSLVIQDETAALALSINANSLYTGYRVGQEVVIDVTDMYIGKYNGLQQLGFPEWYEKGQAWEATFMPLEFFKLHTQLNGLPEPSKIDTLTVNYTEISSATPDVLRRYQSQLVRFNGAHFEGGGQMAFTDGSKVTSNRTLVLADGNSIIVRTSGYSNFWGDILPEGDGDVVGILSYFGTTGWQLLLRSRNDLLNFGDENGPLGSFDNPYSVDHAIEMEAAGTPGQGWVTGYIVGAVAAGKSAVTSNADIEWTADVSMPHTLVIGATAEVSDYASCLVIELPQGSALRQYGNLLDNPGNYGKQIWLKGNFTKVLSTWGISGNDGSAANFRIDGVNVPDQPVIPDKPDTPNPPATGAGTEASPYNVSQVIALNNAGTTSWVEGYIVGWVDGASIASGSHFSVPATGASNILIADSPTGTDVNKCVPVQLQYGSAIRAALNLVDNPGNLGKKVKIEGKLIEYFKKPGLKEPSKYSLEGSSDTPVVPDKPDTPVVPDKPDTPDTPTTGTGTETAPITVTAAIAFNNSGVSAWVKGYIVGWVAGSTPADAKFSAPADRTSNIIIAATANETDPAKCIAVQLPSKSDIRSQLNLQDNAGNLGKEVTINGKLSSFLGMFGLTSPATFKF